MFKLRRRPEFSFRETVSFSRPLRDTQSSDSVSLRARRESLIPQPCTPMPTRPVGE